MGSSRIPTRTLLLSDTHGRNINHPSTPFDLVIHSGDLTQESKLCEFKATLDLLRGIQAPVKIVIAGNHEITLEEETYKKHLAVAGIEPADDAAVREYGHLGEARQLLLAAKEDGVLFLEKGMHTILLPNGATLCLYVNPWTPRRATEGALGTNEAGWAFQYQHSDAKGRFDIPIDQHPDVIITHGPPHGILDRIPGQRAGCPELFASVSRARPQLHCFGHIHVSWGAHLITWRDSTPISNQPTHFTEIDNEKSTILEKLTSIKEGRFDDEESKMQKRDKLEKMLAQGYCHLETGEGIRRGEQTLFVNASVEGDEDVPIQPPFSVVLLLERSKDG